MVHCRHYGMEFQDEIHLGNHFRMHFLFNYSMKCNFLFYIYVKKGNKKDYLEFSIFYIVEDVL